MLFWPPRGTKPRISCQAATVPPPLRYYEVVASSILLLLSRFRSAPYWNNTSVRVSGRFMDDYPFHLALSALQSGYGLFVFLAVQACDLSQTQSPVMSSELGSHYWLPPPALGLFLTGKPWWLGSCHDWSSSGIIHIMIPQEISGSKGFHKKQTCLGNDRTSTNHYHVWWPVA